MEDHFAGDALDLSVWLPHYLPHWSSRASSAATYVVAGGELRLSIPPEQGLWCEDRHDGPLRVSGVQSASFSGPVGSPVGGQPFADGLLVKSEEPEFWGCTPLFGHIEARARGVITSRSMVAFWLSGIEDTPQRLIPRDAQPQLSTADLVRGRRLRPRTPMRQVVRHPHGRIKLVPGEALVKPHKAISAE